MGSALFGIGWAVAGTCPGPAAAQIGQGHLAGLFTSAGIFVGVALQGWLSQRRTPVASPAVSPGACAQTLLARAQVILYRPAPDAFGILVRPSFAGYLRAWLRDATI